MELIRQIKKALQQVVRILVCWEKRREYINKLKGNGSFGWVD